MTYPTAPQAGRVENRPIDWSANVIDADAARREIDLELEQNVRVARRQLAAHLDEAVGKLGSAEKLVEELTGPLYDVEYAETRDGDDVLLHVQMAALQLRAALRIAEEKVTHG
jgi:hypothetical protein